MISIVEMAEIVGSLEELDVGVDAHGQCGHVGSGQEQRHDQLIERDDECEHAHPPERPAV